MKYDKSADALYIALKKGKILRTQEHGGYLVDYNKNGEILGLEILNYSKKAPVLKSSVMGKLRGRGAA